MRIVDLADPQKSRDLRDREPSRLFEARDESLHHHVVGYDGARAFSCHGSDRGERRSERAPQTVEIRELHDLDDRWTPEQETRDRPVAFDDDDDRDAVLARELDLDADTERRDARVRDEDDRARHVPPVDLVHRARIEIRGSDRIGQHESIFLEALRNRKFLRPRGDTSDHSRFKSADKFQ